MNVNSLANVSQRQWLLSSVSVLCQLKISLLCSFNSKFGFFSWVLSLWPDIIPIFYAFCPWLNVIEDPWPIPYSCIV